MLDFGAVGDGLADDTVPIQATLNALPSTGDGSARGAGGAIFLPAGTYKVSGTLSFRAGTTILGAGRHATIIRQMTAGIDSLRARRGAAGSARETVIRDLRIHGPTASTAGAAIGLDDDAAGGSSFEIEDVAVFGHYDGVRIKDAVVGSLLNVRVDSAANDGFVSVGTMNAVSFIGTYAQGCQRNGYSLKGNYCALMSAASDNNGGDGYHFYSDSATDYNNHITLISCGSEQNRGCGLAFDLGESISAQGMYIISPGTDAIRLAGVESAFLSQVRAKGGTGFALNVQTHQPTGRTSKGVILAGGIWNPGGAGKISDTGGVTFLGTVSNPYIGIGLPPGYHLDLMVEHEIADLARFQRRGVAGWVLVIDEQGRVGWKHGETTVFDVEPGAPANALRVGSESIPLGLPLQSAPGNERMGGGSASLGSNSPASSLEAPFRWLRFKTSDGSDVYVPAWK